MNGHNSFDALITSLSLRQLERLHAALSQAARVCGSGAKFDLTAAIEAIKLPPPLPTHGSYKWWSKTSGGRAYELLLMGQDRDLDDPRGYADKQYVAECAEVQEMIRAAITPEDAWKLIRAKYGTYDDPPAVVLVSEDAAGAPESHQPVARPITNARRDGAPSLQRKRNYGLRRKNRVA